MVKKANASNQDKYIPQSIQDESNADNYIMENHLVFWEDTLFDSFFLLNNRVEYEKEFRNSPLLGLQERVDKCFRYSTLEQCLDALKEDGSPWALRTLEKLNAKSPLALKLTFRMMKKAKNLDHISCLE
jgi:hypothetical protein